MGECERLSDYFIMLIPLKHLFFLFQLQKKKKKFLVYMKSLQTRGEQPSYM